MTLEYPGWNHRDAAAVLDAYDMGRLLSARQYEEIQRLRAQGDHLRALEVAVEETLV